MGAITGARVDRLTIGKLSQLTGVNIETIRYYEKINVLPVPRVLRAGVAHTVLWSGAFSPSCGVRASWDFRWTRYAPCCGWAALKKPLAARSGKLPRSTSMTSARLAPLSGRD